MKTNTEEIKNALNETDILDWKQKWGKIYKIKIDNQNYVIRKLQRKEYTKIMSKEEDDENIKSIETLFKRQDLITETVTVYPLNIKDLIKENAGIATILSEKCMQFSGFDIDGEIEEL